VNSTHPSVESWTSLLVPAEGALKALRTTVRVDALSAFDDALRELRRLKKAGPAWYKPEIEDLAGTIRELRDSVEADEEPSDWAENWLHDHVAWYRVVVQLPMLASVVPDELGPEQVAEVAALVDRLTQEGASSLATTLRSLLLMLSRLAAAGGLPRLTAEQLVAALGGP